MKRKLFVVALSMSMLTSLMFGVALAGSTTITGVTGAGSAVQANVAVNCVTFNTTYSFGYDMHAFEVSADGVYTFADAGGGIPNIVPFMVLYDGPFTPGAPDANCVAGWTGFSAPLVAGQTYHLQVLSNFFLCPYYDYPCFGPYAVTISGPGEIILLPNADDRINWDSSASGPVALYCHGDNGEVLEVWGIDLGSGEGVLLFEWTDFDNPTPEVNTLLAQHDSVTLWHLTTGEYQVHAEYFVGFNYYKGYAFIFNGCPYDGGGYTNNFDPNE